MEIYNPYNNVIPLGGWQVEDASGKKTLLPGQPIGFDQYLYVELKGTSMNNDGDTILLRSPGGNIISAVSYASAEKGVSYGFDGEQYRATSTPTPREKNTFAPIVQAIDNPPQGDAGVQTVSADEPVAREEPAKTPPVIPTSDSRGDAPHESPHESTGTHPTKTDAAFEQPTYSIAATHETASEPKTETAKTASKTRTATWYKPATVTKARELPRDTNIRVQGVVSVPPGIFAKQFFYIDGLQIYSYHAMFPELSPGMVIEVRGTVSENRGEKRVKIQAPDAIRVLEEQGEVLPQQVTRLSEDLVGFLVQMRGFVESVTATGIVLATNGERIELEMKEGTGVVTDALSSGMEIEVVGVVVPSGEQLKLLPRFQSDLRTIEVPPEEGPETAIAGGLAPPDWWGGALLLLGSLGAVLYWFLRHRHQTLTITHA